MFGFTHGAVLLAPPEDTLDHFTPRLRHAITLMTCRASVNCALSCFPRLGHKVILRNMWRDPKGTQLGDMIRSIERLVFSRRDTDNQFL